MRSRRWEKQSTRRRQEQEYRDKISNQTLSAYDAPTKTSSEGRLETKPREATQLLLVSHRSPSKAFLG